MCALNVDALLSAWSIDRPWTIQPALTGSNNLSYPVTTPSGHYVLRIHQNTADPERVRYEHTVLTHLAQSALSFAVPAPIPTRSGATLAPVPDDEERTLAALFPLIAGRHPQGSAQQRRLCGRALAELDHALARITLPAPPGTLTPFGSVTRIHPDPAVPQPREMLESLPLEPTQRAQLTRVIGHLDAAVPMLYRSLPQQLVHRDFAASNVLMDGDRVTGVLDFEFAGPDLRVVDLARSLSQFTINPWSSPDGWQGVAAFARGYRERAELGSHEAAALPDAMRLYRLMSLVHREGRRRRGLASEEDVLARAQALLLQEEWLRERHQDLVQLL